MESAITGLASDELITLYHKINSELSRNLLNGLPWDEQQQRIKTLSEISIELTRRKVEIENASNESQERREAIRHNKTNQKPFDNRQN